MLTPPKAAAHGGGELQEEPPSALLGTQGGEKPGPGGGFPAGIAPCGAPGGVLAPLLSSPQPGRAGRPQTVAQKRRSRASGSLPANGPLLYLLDPRPFQKRGRALLRRPPARGEKLPSSSPSQGVPQPVFTASRGEPEKFGYRAVPGEGTGPCLEGRGLQGHSRPTAGLGPSSAVRRAASAGQAGLVKAGNWAEKQHMPRNSRDGDDEGQPASVACLCPFHGAKALKNAPWPLGV